jgi:ABC-type polysaccharide/polyol phosphate transport system ATPase subunit
LRDVDVRVRQGEFFGIVGRNGSGKSTLLKILASIYGADAGRVRMAGRVAPFIELGVGFNVELTARENGNLNGVIMGLPIDEAK